MSSFSGTNPDSLCPGGCEKHSHFIYKRIQTHRRNPNTPAQRRDQRCVTALLRNAIRRYRRISTKADCQRLLFDTGLVTRNVGIIHI